MHKQIWDFHFVDLDNTLIFCENSKWWDGNEHCKTVTFMDKSVFHALLRPGALQFLKELRDLEHSKVFMLTAADSEYANAWNREFGLGFDSMDIFAREDQKAGRLSPDGRFADARRVILYDDLTSFDHRHGKIPFLAPITPWGKVNFVQVPAFHGVPGALNRSLRRDLIRKGLEHS